MWLARAEVREGAPPLVRELACVGDLAGGDGRDVVMAWLVREIAGPLNVVMGLGSSEGNARALLAAGVQRISLGGSIARAALGFVRRCAQELRDAGSIGFAAAQIPQSELNALFARARTAAAPLASNR